MSELERLRWRLSALEDDYRHDLRKTARELRSELEDLKECIVDWHEFDEFRQNVEKKVGELESRLAKLEARFAELEKIARGEKWRWNPDAVKWEKATGQSGEYERSEDFDNPEFKAMLKDLAEHGGKLTRDGWFYWTFKNGSTVGRKKKSKEAERDEE